MIKKDVVGTLINNLFVLEEIRIPYVGKQKNRKTVLKIKCRCICGTLFTPYKNNVLTGKTTKCTKCQNSKIKIGNSYGSLKVISRGERSNQGRNYLCLCTCSHQENISSHILLHGRDKRCTHCRFYKKFHPKPTRPLKVILKERNFETHLKTKSKKIGKKFGRLKIISFSHWEQEITRKRAWYNSICECGNKLIVRGDLGAKSCGCLHKDSCLKGQYSPVALLTKKQVDAIREFKKSNIGYTGRQLSQIFGVHETVISSIILNKTYKD